MSPIPLGILAAAGAGGGEPAYDLLETTVLTSSASSITFDNLGTVAADYKQLQIRMTARSTATGTNQNGRIFFNGDETFLGGNYYTHFLEGTGSSVASGGGNYTAPFQLPGDSILPLDMFAAATIDILDFSSNSKNTTIRALNGWPGDSGSGAVTQIFLRSTLWNNTNSVTSLKIADATGFRIGSRFSLYGIKAA